MFTLYSADFIGNPGNCSYPHILTGWKIRVK